MPVGKAYRLIGVSQLTQKHLDATRGQVTIVPCLQTCAFGYHRSNLVFMFFLVLDWRHLLLTHNVQRPVSSYRRRHSAQFRGQLYI